MEGILPHPNLKELQIEGYDGLRLTRSMNQLGSVLPHLVEIRLQYCGKCQHLPSFGQLASLKLLSLFFLSCVEYMESPTAYKCALSSAQPSAAAMPLFFPSLEVLELEGMLNMKGWWKGEEGTSTGDEQGSEITDQPWQQHTSHPQAQLPSFPKLISSTILTCPRLTSSKPLSSSVERLILNDIDEKMMAFLKENSVTMSSDPSSSFSSPAFSNLKLLEIWNPRTSVSSPNYCFKDLVSLRYLSIIGSDKLHSLSGAVLEHLTSLETLLIRDCKELDLLDDETMPWKALKNLSHLELGGIPKMSSLPTGFQYLTSLEILQISDCKELDLLGDQMMPWKALKNLRHLDLGRIPKMSTVPTGFRHLTALRKLSIIRCGLSDLPEWVTSLPSLEGPPRCVNN